MRSNDSKTLKVRVARISYLRYLFVMFFMSDVCYKNIIYNHCLWTDFKVIHYLCNLVDGYGFGGRKFEETSENQNLHTENHSNPII